MKRYFLFALFCLGLLACNNSAEEKKPVNRVDTFPAAEDTMPPVRPGSDRDEHGCIPSAGYTWSVLRNKCIRLFEEETIQLKSFAGEERAAFLIFSPDHSEAELFLPTESSSILLHGVKNHPGEWEQGTWLLQKKDRYTLMKNGSIAFLQ